jgi:lipoyl-dependent peroxiredoxin
MATFSRRAQFRWHGELAAGSGEVAAGTHSFSIPVRFPSIASDPPGHTTPEELLAASHAACYGIGLHSLIRRSGGHAEQVLVEAIVTAEKGADGIRILSSHLIGLVKGLAILDEKSLQQIATDVAENCTISLALRGTVRITHEVRVESSESPGA